MLLLNPFGIAWIGVPSARHALAHIVWHIVDTAKVVLAFDYEHAVTLLLGELEVRLHLPTLREGVVYDHNAVAIEHVAVRLA